MKKICKKCKSEIIFSQNIKWEILGFDLILKKIIICVKYTKTCFICGKQKTGFHFFSFPISELDKENFEEIVKDRLIKKLNLQ